MIELYPAIDLRGGRCVRLHQGDFAAETVYGDDAVGTARSFASAGARWIHVVDLDAARTGEPVNRPLVAAIVAAVAPLGVRVQTGGGVRTVADAAALAAAGAARVVIGTAALERPEVVAAAASVVEVAVGLDHRAGELAVHGWTAGAGVAVLEAIGWFPDAAAFVVTDISRDGTLGGPDLDGLAAVCARTSAGVIASGGVASLDDLRSLAVLPLAGIITGKALYEGRFGLVDALAALAGIGR